MLEWQQSIYSYVLRLVRNSDDAADLTQEVFATALRHFDRVASDARRPWIYRVATNAVYKRSRDEKRRKRRERESAMREDPRAEQPEVDLDAAERREILQDQLDSMAPQQRSLLVLHYFAGLSHREVAAALDLPRTTVSSRIRAGLRDLKVKLTAAGHGALVPHVDTLLTTPIPAQVPADLTHTLLTLAADTTAASTTSSLLAGGALMSKKLLFVAIVLSCGGFLGGYALQGVGASKQREAHDAALSKLSDAQRKLKALEKEFDRQEEALAVASRNLRQAEEELESVSKVAALPGNGGGVSRLTGESVDVGAAGIDWAQLAKLSRDNRDVITTLAALLNDGKSPSALTPEDQVRFRGLGVELENAAAMARLESPYPMLDEEMLPEIINVYMGALLDLDDKQLANVTAMALELRKGYELPDGATPLEAYSMRMGMLNDFTDQIDRHLTPNQRESWESMQPVWSEISRGSHRRLELGLQSGSARDRVTENMTDHYRLTADQQVRFTPIVDQYLESARSLLGTYDQVGADRRTLSEAESRELDEAQDQLQRQIENEILALLSDEQLSQLQSQIPLLFRFGDTGNINISHNDGGGF